MRYLNAEHTPVTQRETIDVLATRLQKIACAKCGKHLDVSAIAPFTIIHCPECQTEMPVPALLGPFLLVEVLGSGGMGAVYRAVDQALGRQVAIKVMKASMGVDQQLVDSFLREARAAAALNHPNIVQIYSCGQERGQPYIVMELVGGGRLDQLISGNKPVPEARILEIALNVAEGLKAANEVGLVHGDIKPANILFDDKGTAKVVDFGLAQFVNRQAEQSGGIWGTPYYISPERARGGKADHRSDIYSLGATLFHALTGQPPFDGKTAQDVVLARLKAPPPDARSFNPALHGPTASLIARMLSPEPATRYPNTASLMADLREALQVAKSTPSPTAEKKADKKGGRKGLIIGAAIAAVAVVGGLLAVLLPGHKDKKAQPPATNKAAVVASVTSAPPAAASNAAVSAYAPRNETEEFLMNQLFSAQSEQRIVKAAAKLTGPKPLDMFEDLDVYYLQLPETNVRTLWIRLLQLVPCLQLKMDGDVNKYIKDVAERPWDDKKKGYVEIPRAIGKYLAAPADEAALQTAAAAWPPPFRDLAVFYRGLANARTGGVENARAALQAYAACTSQPPAWIYSFQPVARHLLAQMDKVDAARPNLTQLVSENKRAEAEALIKSLKGEIQPLLWPLLSAEQGALQKVQQQEDQKRKQAEQKAAEERKKADLAARAVTLQEDLDRIDELIAANIPLLVKKDFAAAAQAAEQAAGTMKTDEGKATLNLVKDSYQRMEDLKAFLIARIPGTSLRGVAELGGADVVGADAAGLNLAFPGRGSLQRPWAQVDPRALAKVAAQCAADPKLEAKERADRLASVAVLCYFIGNFEGAAAYAGQAVKQEGSVKPVLRKLMPDILPD